MVQNLFLSSTNLLLKMIGKEEEKEKSQSMDQSESQGITISINSCFGLSAKTPSQNPQPRGSYSLKSQRK